jgi:hypothetical protein
MLAKFFLSLVGCHPPNGDVTMLKKAPEFPVKTPVNF